MAVGALATMPSVSEFNSAAMLLSESARKDMADIIMNVQNDGVRNFFINSLMATLAVSFFKKEVREAVGVNKLENDINNVITKVSKILGISKDKLTDQ